MNVLRRSSLGLCLALFLLILSGLLSNPDPAFASSVNSLGDYDTIAVMEALGDYAAIDANGDVNYALMGLSVNGFNDHEGAYE